MKSKIFALSKEIVADDLLVGNGKKRVLVVVAQSEAGEKTLIDLLTAVKLDINEDIILLSVPNKSDVDINNILEKHNVEKMVSFGFEPKQLGFNIVSAFYHIYKIGTLETIFSQSISSLNEDKNKKIALWKSLQTVFLK